MSSTEPEVTKAFKSWYQDLKPMKRYGGLPAKGTIAAALIVLERLRLDCRLDIKSHLAKGGAQIAGLSLSALRKILERFGEMRPFPSEGGRTNRGNNRPVQLLLECLKNSELSTFPKSKRTAIIDKLQMFLVHSLDGYYTLERISFDFNSSKPARHLIMEILERAKQRDQSGPIAQHLIGAKLAIRFPHIEVANFPYSAADDQVGRPGDFFIGNTAFHVTMAPNMHHVERCDQNIREGLSAYLLVPDSKLIAARALLETQNIENRVTAESIESFVGQNLAEMGEFSQSTFSVKMAALLTEYNQRVKSVETDTSLQIEIPASLRISE